MINKKFGLMVLSLAAMGLVSCGGGGGSSQGTGGKTSTQVISSGAVQTFDLTNGESIAYWCTSGDKQFFEDRIVEFKAAHPEFTGDITLDKTVDESDVASQLSKDITAAPELFEIVDDALPGCVRSRQLEEFPASDTAEMAGVYGSETVAATQVLGKTYGVPYRNDNGYVLTYDDQIVSAEQAKTVEGILAACKAAGATFNYNIKNSWYTFAPIWGAGGKNYTAADGSYHSEIATDAIAQALADFTVAMRGANEEYVNTWNSSDSVDNFGAASNKVGAVISWNGEANVQAKIGDHTKCTVLPTFTSQGKQIPLSTFHGHKTISIRKGVEGGKLLTARAFALFMGSDAVAEKRVTELKHGVPNLTVKAKTSIWTSQWVNSMQTMIQDGRAVSQLSAGVGSFWTPAENLGTSVFAGATSTKETALRALTACQTAQLGE